MPALASNAAHSANSIIVPGPHAASRHPWTIDERNDACFIIHDANRQALAYVYFEEEPGRRSARLHTCSPATSSAAIILPLIREAT